MEYMLMLVGLLVGGEEPIGCPLRERKDGPFGVV